MQLVHIGVLVHVQCPGNNVIEHYTYFVSGQPSYLTANTMDNRFLFKGSIFIAQAEIYDMRNRFYHPNLGRFMQSDPIGFDAGDMNLFRYCGNDPVDMTDPMGLEDIPVSDELNRLGIQASLNSRRSFVEHPGLGSGSRGQLIQENIATHRLSLQNKIVQGYVEDVYKRVTGSFIPRLAGHKVLEAFLPDRGYRSRGFGHAHDDKRGASPKSSGEDWAVARGTVAAGGQKPELGNPVWTALTSNATAVNRLTPQTVPGQKPTERPFSTKGIPTTNPPPPITNSPRIGSSGPTAADIDAAHQGIGVPSLAAEAVNFAPGKP